MTITTTGTNNITNYKQSFMIVTHSVRTCKLSVLGVVDHKIVTSQ